MVKQINQANFGEYICPICEDKKQDNGIFVTRRIIPRSPDINTVMICRSCSKKINELNAKSVHEYRILNNESL